MNEDVMNLQYTTIKDPLPNFIYEGLKEYSSGANIYRPQPVVLIEKLATRLNIPKEYLFLTAGADEGIQLFAKTYGQNAFVFTPTYTVYQDVEEFGGKLTRIYSIKDNNFIINTALIDGATLVYLANPNNPSGVTSKEQVMELVTNNKKAIVVIDEAYGEFSNLSVVDQVINNPNMVVLRSFSKSYSMAGNRIGFIVANPKILDIVKNKTQWANISYLSVGAAIVALDHEEYFKNRRDEINKRREDFASFLKSLGFVVLPSNINAVLLKFTSEDKGTSFFKYLEKNNIIASHGNGASNMGLDKSFVRIAIGNSIQMEKVKEVISLFKKISRGINLGRD